MKSKGFTLVELLVVIAIVGLLSGVAVVATNSSRSKARYARVVADLAQITKAVEAYTQTSGSGYPADVGGGAMPAELAAYMAQWPTPPCSGWVYDYENWNSGNTIEIHVQRPGVNIFYFCIYSAGGNACGTGAEITSYASKAISCSE